MKRIFKLLFNSKSLGVLMVALMLPLGLNLAEAGNPKCPGDHQSCKDDGGSDLSYVTSPADNWAFWDGGVYIWEQTDPDFLPRYCGDGNPADPNPQGQVAYLCHESAYDDWPMKNTVHINLDPNWRDGDPEGPGDKDLTADDLCKLAEDLGTKDDYVLVMNLPTSESLSYYYGMDPTWNEGPCTGDPGTCKVIFATQAYFNDLHEHPEHCIAGKCGRRVQLAGLGQASPAGKIDDIYEYNPFVYRQEIPIVDLTVTFRAVGKSKVAARCYYKPQGVWFRTCVVPNCEQ